MSTITPTPLPDAVTSNDEIVAMLIKAEGFQGGVYADNGHPDIGYGVQLNSTNMPWVLQAMNVPQNLAAACDAAIAAAPNNAAAWQAALDAVLANNGIAQTFHLTQPQAQLALQLIVTNVTIPSLDALLNANGINYLTTPNGHNSQEYMALLSLFYNGGTNTVGPSLLADLVNQNRAAAWYEIRYQTDANDPNGAIERRRYYESNVFGLSTTADTYQDALQDYEVLTQHRPVILGKEVANVTVTINGQPQNYTFGADPDGAQPEVAPGSVTDSQIHRRGGPPTAITVELTV